jgi:hypothetical protein
LITYSGFSEPVTEIRPSMVASIPSAGGDLMTPSVGKWATRRYSPSSRPQVPFAGPISCSEEGARSVSRYVAVLAQFQRHAIDGILSVGCHVCDPNILSMQKSSPIMPACKELRLAGGVVRIWVNSDVHKGFFVRRSVNTR